MEYLKKIESKECDTCNEDKPLSDYYISKGYYQNICKKCHSKKVLDSINEKKKRKPVELYDVNEFAWWYRDNPRR
jgi:hypothetical protein